MPSARKRILGPAGHQLFIFGRQNKYSCRQKLHLIIMEYNKLSIFYLALTEKNALDFLLNFLANGFCSWLDYQPVFGKMSPHSSVNLLKQVFKLKVQEMEYTFRQTNFRNHKKTIWVIKEQKLQTFVLRPMYLHVQQMITSLQKEVMSLMFPGKEVDFVKSLFDKQHDFNGTSLEVNKIQQSFYLGHHTQQKFA